MKTAFSKEKNQFAKVLRRVEEALDSTAKTKLTALEARELALEEKRNKKEGAHKARQRRVDKVCTCIGASLCFSFFSFLLSFSVFQSAPDLDDYRPSFQEFPDEPIRDLSPSVFYVGTEDDFV